MNSRIKILDLGRMDYKPSWDFQKNFHQDVLSGKETDTLILVEHEPVYTLGKNANKEHLLDKSDSRVKVYNVERGGDITFHGPGQIVGYPILDLDNFFTDIHKYLRLIEECIIQTLGDFNIKAKRSNGQTGVWTDNKNNESKKICAIGIRTSRWVTMHGFALNVNTDLSFFENIVPCGIIGKEVTSIKNELKKEIDMNLVIDSIRYNFSTQFNAKII